MNERQGGSGSREERGRFNEPSESREQRWGQGSTQRRRFQEDDDRTRGFGAGYDIDDDEANDWGERASYSDYDEPQGESGQSGRWGQEWGETARAQQRRRFGEQRGSEQSEYGPGRRGYGQESRYRSGLRQQGGYAGGAYGQQSYGQGGYGQRGAYGRQGEYGESEYERDYGDYGEYGRGYGQSGYGQERFREGRSFAQQRGFGRASQTGYGQGGFRESSSGRGGFGESRYGRQSGIGQSAYGRSGREYESSSRGSHRGKGPKGYQRSGERLKEIICENLKDDPDIDASDVSIDVNGETVTLEGTVDSRQTKYAVEECAEQCGASNINNNLRIGQEETESTRWSGSQSSERQQSESKTTGKRS